MIPGNWRSYNDIENLISYSIEAKNFNVWLQADIKIEIRDEFNVLETEVTRLMAEAAAAEIA